MSVTFEKFLVKEDFEGYEDPVKYETFKPKLEKYVQNLNENIKPEYAITLPKPIEELRADQFNAVDYLYKEKLLTEKEFEITDCNNPELAEKISKGEYSSVDVLKAFAKRATIAHQLTNCAMEIFIDEGLERAKYLDEYLAKNGKTIGPLHGLPISLKEHYKYKGKVCHASFVSLIDNVAEDHSTTIQILENLGAVFYIRTNQPQCLMHLCSENNYVGGARSPYNISLSAGGSSSGEGALVSMGGSVAGVGSDIGGSVRSPAAFSGCFSLRPSNKRISLAGAVASGSGQESIVAVCGPLARSLEDVDYWMKSYINDGEPWELDQDCVRMPWRDVPKPAAKDLTIAVMYDDGIVKPTPPIQRGLKETVAKLEKAGVKIVEFKPIKAQEALDLINDMYTADGNVSSKKLLSQSGEPLTKLTKWYLNYGRGKKSFTIYENHQLNVARDLLRQEYLEYFNNNKIDFILSPTSSNVAPKPEEVFNWSYTTLWNILDSPTIVFQTGLFQDPKIDKWDDSFKDYKYRSDLEELELTNYKPEEFIGAPIGLQLSGKRYYDEEVVAAGKTIGDILGVKILKN
ncbi:putative acetamidase [[Candida] jaroonii]|uniref:Acetamidase n=1 Tax=[Candida] jaroonii TaxID=467808 RepID=A0ACA9Y0V8_9ASCO|nr:putative acetamidase [[Candida] jaroonii]